MIATLMDGLSWFFVIVGILALLTGGIGVLRLPDIYTRMHAASLTDTLAAGALLLTMMLQSPDWLVAVKLGLIGVFLYFTSPTSSFALAHAALTSGIEPVLADDLTEGSEPGDTR